MIPEAAVAMLACARIGAIHSVVFGGFAANDQQTLFDLRLYDFTTRHDTLLAANIPLAYGIEWSWSPTGRYIAFTRSGSSADGKMGLVSVPDGAVG